MGSFGGFEWLIIIVIIIFFFGANKIPQMARGLAQGYTEFRKAAAKDAEEIEAAETGGEDPPARGSDTEYKQKENSPDEDTNR